MKSLNCYLLDIQNKGKCIYFPGGKAYKDDDDENEITDPLEEFNENWVEDQCKLSFDMLRLFFCKRGNQIALNGLFANICIGPHLFRRLGVNADSKPTKTVIIKLQKYLVSLQWHLACKKGTSTDLVLADPANPDALGKLMSMISISKGNAAEFDYIKYADILGILDSDDEQSSIKQYLTTR